MFGLPQLLALLSSPHAHLLHSIYHAPAALDAAPRLPARAALHAMPPAFFAQCSGLATPPPAALAAVLALPPPPRAAALLARHPRALVLDRVSDPGNLGTLLRTALALRWGVLLSRGCCDPYNDKVLRAGCGAVLAGHWAWLEDGGEGGEGELESEAPGNGSSSRLPRALALAEAEAAALAPLPPAAPAPPLTLLLLPGAQRELGSLLAPARAAAALRVVVGSEAHGLSRAWLSAPAWPRGTYAHARLGPPGGVLNASIAAAMAMYALTPPPAGAPLAPLPQPEGA